MNKNEAIEILNLNDEKICELNIKKKYRVLALLYHPDKNKNEDANEKFQKINEAYNCLMNNENTNKEITYKDLIFDFLENHFDIKDNNTKEKIYIYIDKNINSFIQYLLLKYFNDNNLINIYRLIEKFENNINIFDNKLINKIKSTIINKVSNIEQIILNPILSDLLEDNIYKFNYKNEFYYIPLWHEELIYDYNESEFIIKIEPNLPENISLDNNNNLLIDLEYNIRDIWDREEIFFYLESKEFKLIKKNLTLKKMQKVILKNQGISKIDHNNIFNNKNRSDIIINLSLTM
tara:strand:- start:2542 stop:3417 length:876 start_codon:yes stop_codon:yes gene_type:complete